LTSGTCTVSGATVTLAAQGTCTIRATQSGSASFAAATPVDQSFAISTGAFLQYTYDAAGNVIKIERVGSR
jgi:CRP-like cAMP-binding protein